MQRRGLRLAGSLLRMLRYLPPFGGTGAPGIAIRVYGVSFADGERGGLADQQDRQHQAAISPATLASYRTSPGSRRHKDGWGTAQHRCSFWGSGGNADAG